MHYEHERREKLDRARVAAVMPAPDRSLMVQMDRYLERRGLSPAVAKYNHWYTSRSAGDCQRRIVIPASNQFGLAYWQGRLIIGDADVKRYTSPPVPRGDSIIVVWPLVPSLPLVVVAEGPMDALRLAEAGTIGIALMGKEPAPEAFEHIAKNFSSSPIVLVPDMDSVEAAGQWMQLLAQYGRESRVLLPSPFNDLAAAPLGHVRRLLDAIQR